MAVADVDCGVTKDHHPKVAGGWCLQVAVADGDGGVTKHHLLQLQVAGDRMWQLQMAMVV